MSKPLSPEFRLAAACCQWPPSQQKNHAIRAAGGGPIDWDKFRRVVKRQRVAGMVFEGLSATATEAPEKLKQEIAEKANSITRQNLLLVAESFRLQQIFDAAKIPAAFFKGVSLAQQAYGSMAIKHSRDIDLLVPPGFVQRALRLLEGTGYQLQSPAKQLSDSQVAKVIGQVKEVTLVHGAHRQLVELHWRPVDNPLVLAGFTADIALEYVTLSSGIAIRTFGEEEMAIYLCAHGAFHSWYRLKWLADFNALISRKSEAEIVDLYRAAKQRNVGLCMAQGLSLCSRILHRKLPDELAAEFAADHHVQRLVAIAIKAMAGSDEEIHDLEFGSTRLNLTHFLLGRGWRFWAAQIRIDFINLDDVLRFPLPGKLYFLYLFFFAPLWLLRRARRNSPI